jgi:uncharacterized repeat protein (TIGR03803 family)
MSRSSLAALYAAVALVLGCAGSACSALAGPLTFSVVHQFNSPAENYGPIPLVTDGGSVLIGSLSGGSAPFLYQINSDGSGYQVLYTFPSGAEPSDLTLVGSTLYGQMFQTGRIASVFKINTNGTDYTTLMSFPAGQQPMGGLTLAGSTLYGTYSPFGTIFEINTDGTGYKTIYSANSNGAEYPNGDFLLIGSTLYGTSMDGGASGTHGTVFRINEDGTGFSILHSFTDTSTDGNNPYDGLITDGTYLYGTTLTGGAFGKGTIFRMDLDGTGFTLLHSLDSVANNDGSYPLTSLTLVGSTLFGTTSGQNGFSDPGTIFELNTDGTDFQLLYGEHAILQNPSALAVDGSVLFGMGTNGADPMLFELSNSVPEPSTLFLMGCGGAALAMSAIFRRRIAWRRFVRLPA